MEQRPRDALLDLITKWHGRAQKIQRSHYDAAQFFDRCDNLMGIPIVVLSASAGAAALLGWLSSLLGGIISLVVALLAGVQSFMCYSHRAARHRIAAGQYAAVRRTLEEIRANIDHPDTNAKHEVTCIRKQVDALSIESHELPMWILKRHGHSADLPPPATEDRTILKTLT